MFDTAPDMINVLFIFLFFSSLSFFSCVLYFLVFMFIINFIYYIL